MPNTTILLLNETTGKVALIGIWLLLSQALNKLIKISNGKTKTISLRDKKTTSEANGKQKSKSTDKETTPGKSAQMMAHDFQSTPNKKLITGACTEEDARATLSILTLDGMMLPSPGSTQLVEATLLFNIRVQIRMINMFIQEGFTRLKMKKHEKFGKKII